MILINAQFAQHWEIFLLPQIINHRFQAWTLLRCCFHFIIQAGLNHRLTFSHRLTFNSRLTFSGRLTFNNLSIAHLFLDHNSIIGDHLTTVSRISPSPPQLDDALLLNKVKDLEVEGNQATDLSEHGMGESMFSLHFYVNKWHPSSFTCLSQNIWILPPIKICLRASRASIQHCPDPHTLLFMYFNSFIQLTLILIYTWFI